MRETIRDKDRINHIVEAINAIVKYKDKYTLQEAQANPIIYYGFVKYVEIIGEAVYMLSKEFKESHTEVEWNVIEKIRHVLVHGYYQITPEQLWETVTVDIPSLKPYIENIQKTLL